MTTIEAAAIERPRGKRGPKCLCCIHPEAVAINAAILAGDGIRPIAARFGMSKQSVARHRDGCLPTPAMQEAAIARFDAEGMEGASLADGVLALHQKALALLAKAEAADDIRGAMMGIREARDCLLAVGKLRGIIDDSTTINITAAPIVLELQQAVMIGLASYPEAKASVLRELARLSGRDAPLTIAHEG